MALHVFRVDNLQHKTFTCLNEMAMSIHRYMAWQVNTKNDFYIWGYYNKKTSCQFVGYVKVDVFQIMSVQFSSVHLRFRLNGHLRAKFESYECALSNTIPSHSCAWCNLVTNYILIINICHAGWWVWMTTITTNTTYWVYLFCQQIKRLL